MKTYAVIVVGDHLTWASAEVQAYTAEEAGRQYYYRTGVGSGATVYVFERAKAVVLDVEVGPAKIEVVRK